MSVKAAKSKQTDAPSLETSSDEMFTTGRATVPAMEEVLGHTFKVLDHGFIRVVDYMGDDAAVVQAARVSYGKGTKQKSQDRGLIRYLMRHRHTTPFEMCEIKFHVKLPIFVARQWIRHRTASVNEYSARYSILDKEFYTPDRAYLEGALKAMKAEKQIEKQMQMGQQDLFGSFENTATLNVTAAQSKANKQGRESVLDADEAAQGLKTIDRVSNNAYKTYEELLNEDAAGTVKDPNRKGMARELARMVLPTNYYTQWYWKVDLHNLLHFVSLRADSHAQYEIRVYADIMCDILRRWVPLTWEAFEDYRKGGAFLSRQEKELVQRMLKGERLTQEASGLSAREWREFTDRFSINEK
jgi:thymidylate synthase (FAD)